jgi:ferric-dicitrate binding protein FerR (iron transport regulator)
MSIDRFWVLLARKLSGESSVEEIRELEEILRIHPHLHFSVETITNLWNQHSGKEEEKLEDAYVEHIERMKRMGVPLQHEHAREEIDTHYLLEGSRKNLNGRRFAVAATIIALILTAGYFSFFHSRRTSTPSPVKAEKLAVSTKYGSRTKIQLPDGSKVWLNSGSTIKYDKQFGTDIREVVLSGEAFFDVVKNADKPFIIHTVSMDVKVLGTQFNIKSYANDKQSEATLIHGSIEVLLKKRGFENILLKPNQKIVVINDAVLKDSLTPAGDKSQESVITVQKLNYAPADSSIVETSWVDNKLSFRDESFEDIARRMERWYGTIIRFADPSVKSIRFTGTFTNETVEQALEALQITADFHFTRQSNTVLISKRKQPILVNGQDDTITIKK